MSGRCLEGALRMSGRCLGGLWNVGGWCPDGDIDWMLSNGCLCGI